MHRHSSIPTPRGLHQEMNWNAPPKYQIFFFLGLFFGVAFFRAPSPDARPVWLPEARDLGYAPPGVWR